MDHLESRALAQFDRLVSKGELLWTAGQSHLLRSSSFIFEFRIAQSLSSKPWDSPSIKSETSEPLTKTRFIDKDPDFDLGKVGDHHRLILNKYSVVRPQFVLPTLEYERQSDALNARDFHAAKVVLEGIGREYMVIFNCGHNSGSSIGHKHLQVIPRSKLPDGTYLDEANLLCKPSLYSVRTEAVSLDQTANEHVIVYDQLRHLFAMSPDHAHNVIMTDRRLAVIPRTKPHIVDDTDVTICANAAAMVGMVWCNSREQYDAWMRYGPVEALKALGEAPLASSR